MVTMNPVRVGKNGQNLLMHIYIYNVRPHIYLYMVYRMRAPIGALIGMQLTFIALVDICGREVA